MGQNTGSPVILHMVIVSKGTCDQILFPGCAGEPLGMLVQQVNSQG